MRSHGNNLLHLVNKYIDLFTEHPETIAYKAKAEKYAKIIAKTIILSGMDAGSFGQNAYFYDAAEGVLTASILLVAEFCKPEERHIVSVFKIIQELLAPSNNKQRYHSMMHLAFKQAVKRRVIPTNPCDQADRPKAVQYIGTYYNSAEIKQLLECLDGDPMKIAVILTAYYGLRRSEVLGLKWDAIDPVEDKIYIRHKIIENKLNGNEIEGLDVMKTKSSYRSLPLMPFIKKALEEERTRQEEMQRVLRKSYNRKYLDYVCVDAMGDILKPQYVTEHFKVILERNGLKKIRFHDLRHSCASLMLANDISMKEIQEWLGHSNISTTANIYAHVDSESKRESARIIDKVLSTEEAV